MGVTPRDGSRSMHEENKATMAALDQRVLGLEGDVQALRHDLSSGIASLRSDFVSSFNQISTKIDNRDDRRWILGPAVGFLMFILAVVGGLGTLSLSPVKERVGELQAEMRATERDLIERDRRLWDHSLKMRSEFDFLRGQLSPRVGVRD